MKKESGTLDATPSKRTFLSIIADYDLNRSICELVDNALDVWVRSGKSTKVTVGITLNQQQQIITVEDDAGGLSKSELRYIVGPGQTGTKPTDETIGIFGVGSKRAVVALAQDVKIKTRYANEDTFQIEFDDNWIKDEDWNLPVYEIDPIKPSTTIVELKSLRSQLTDETISLLKDHLQTTYALFLANKSVSIILDGQEIVPKVFDNWAYPPNYAPRRFKGELTASEGYKVKVAAIAGLTLESSPATGEYGVYFYCNDRLVARAMRTFEVGFTRGLAGLPHAKVSLTRVLIFLNGDARGMPWNSSKSDINVKHHIFLALHDWLVNVVKQYATLSRIWVGEWPEKVFQYKKGKIEDIGKVDFPNVPKTFLPPFPKSRPRYADIITTKNRKIGTNKPWTIGLYEAVIAVDFLSKQNLQQKNRISLVILDSTLEIAFKEYLVNGSNTAYSDVKLLNIFSSRHEVHKEIKKTVNLAQKTWKKVLYYYNLRCELIHKKATVAISDLQIRDFREVVENILTKPYKLNFK